MTPVEIAHETVASTGSERIPERIVIQMPISRAKIRTCALFASSWGSAKGRGQAEELSGVIRHGARRSFTSGEDGFCSAPVSGRVAGGYCALQSAENSSQIRGMAVAAVLVLLLGIAPRVHADNGPSAVSTVQRQVAAGQPVRLAQAQGEGKESVRVSLHDLELIDQDGSSVKFKSDVIGDRVAVIIPFYTTCTTAYPILIFMFTRLQEMLGERLGKEVVLVSVSVDPRTDIPVRLKAYARRQKAKPGWMFLSGDRNNLGQVLLGVGVLFSPNIDEHNHIPITLVGSARGEWRRFHGFPSPEQILAEINRALTTRNDS